ncbi:MAG TPA: glycosyl hydrolase [Polyangiaceae bacterium]|nr:glycosyl hydrolase [Polyangiaceae bacterium]
MTTNTSIGSAFVITSTAFALGLAMQACSSNEGSGGGSGGFGFGGAKQSSSSGGAREQGSGGMTASQGGGAGTSNTEGGRQSSGGMSAQSGGKASSGGSGVGGSGAGGTDASGGMLGAGGRMGSGGRTGTGGRAGTGGDTATGGRQASGGALGLGGSGGSTQASGGSGGRNLLVPESGALLGLYYGDASIAATATKLGRSLPLHLTYYAWEDDFTRAETAKDLSAGRIPFVNWELFGGELDDIIAGKYDSMLQQRARDTKALGKPLFIDFGAEMNGDWSPWGGAQNGESAAKYLTVYRKVHDAFEDAGATNAIWAFCPNVTDEPRAAWNEALDYYPGDDYVDWMCVDGYNWGDTDGGGWQSFEQVFQAIYPKLAAKNKPIMIGEMASAESGGNKGAWIDAMIPTLKNKYPQIRGVLWFDVDKETDWRVSSSPAAEAAFKKMANDPYFNP